MRFRVRYISPTRCGFLASGLRQGDRIDLLVTSADGTDYAIVREFDSVYDATKWIEQFLVASPTDLPRMHIHGATPSTPVSWRPWQHVCIIEEFN